MKPKTKPVSNLNFMVIVGAGLVGIVLLSGLIILVLGIIRAETFIWRIFRIWRLGICFRGIKHYGAFG